MAQLTGSSAVRSNVAVVSGLGGVGKSQLAEEYALRFGAAYPGGIFWLNGPGSDTDATSAVADVNCQSQLSKFADALGITDRVFNDVGIDLSRELERRGRPFLWVVDDVHEGFDGNALRRWLAPHPLGRTIITTRSRTYRSFAEGVELGPLSPDDALELLVSRRTPLDEDERAAARGITEDLGCHPLALDVTGAALASYGVNEPFREFRARLTQPNSDALGLAEKLADILPNGHQTGIATTISSSVQELESEGRDFLRLAAVVGHRQVPLVASFVVAVLQTVDALEHSEAVERQALAFQQVTRSCLADLGASGTGRGVHPIVTRSIDVFERANSQRISAIREAAIRVLRAQIAACNHTLLELAYATFIVSRALQDRDLDSVTVALGVSIIDDYTRRGERSFNFASTLAEGAATELGICDNTLHATRACADAFELVKDYPHAINFRRLELEGWRKLTGNYSSQVANGLGRLERTLRAHNALDDAERVVAERCELYRYVLHRSGVARSIPDVECHVSGKTSISRTEAFDFGAAVALFTEYRANDPEVGLKVQERCDTLHLDSDRLLRAAVVQDQDTLGEYIDRLIPDVLGDKCGRAMWFRTGFVIACIGRRNDCPPYSVLLWSFLESFQHQIATLCGVADREARETTFLLIRALESYGSTQWDNAITLCVGHCRRAARLQDLVLGLDGAR
jgi:hypothetical protein